MVVKKSVFLTIFCLFLELSLTACGGGGITSNKSNQIGTDIGTNTETDVRTNTSINTTTNISVKYDLSEYLFHDNLLSNNGEKEFVENFYWKEEGELITNTHKHLTSTDGMFINERADNSLIKTHRINRDNIEENVINSNVIRFSDRYVNVGDTYLDADNTQSTGANPMTQNASCTVLEHLDSFDLSTATGNFNLASGVYDDVLKIECITSFVTNNTRSPHTTLRSYHAKDVGIIFGEGSAFFYGDIYVTEVF